MLMESQLEFRSPWKISGTLHQNSIAAFSYTAEEDRELF